MAIALSTGTGQSTNVTAAQTLLMPAVGNYRLLSQKPDEAVFVYASGALDQPNKLRHAVQKVSNAFANTGVAPDSGQRTEGLSLLSQVIETWKVEDAANTAFNPYYLPVSGHMVLKFPQDALITSTVLEAFMRRVFGSIFASAAATLAQAIDPMLHEVVVLR